MILENIVADNLPDLEAKKREFPVEQLMRRIEAQTQPLDFTRAIKGDGVKLIAEVKKASPSKGIIRVEFDPEAIALTYISNGASAISVLTEEKYFQGSLVNLEDVKIITGSNIPVLRKDFIHDPYQVYESRANGADAILLIAAILSSEKLQELLILSHKLGMSCLVEVHNVTELETALKSGAKIIGINNRDLKTFKVDLRVTEKLKPIIPADRIVVSESGIHSREDMNRMRKLGINAVLVGEALMASEDIGAEMRMLLGETPSTSFLTRKDKLG
jgi:indole-3-glycerol phosphate synthase